MLGVSFEGFDVYMQEDKSVLGEEQLLKLIQKLAQQPHLTVSRSVRKGEMMPLHWLLFCFVVKNIFPRGQGRNLADPMDICYTDLLDRSEQINLPAIMISRIGRIVKTSKDHDMEYRFLLKSVFEKLGIPLQKRIGFQVNDEIGNSTLIGCGFKVTKGCSATSEQGLQTPLGPIPSEPSTSSAHIIDTLLQDEITLKGEIAEAKQVLTEEKTLNAKRHENLLSALLALIAKFPPPPSSTWTYSFPCF